MVPYGVAWVLAAKGCSYCNPDARSRCCPPSYATTPTCWVDAKLATAVVSRAAASAETVLNGYLAIAFCSYGAYYVLLYAKPMASRGCSPAATCYAKAGASGWGFGRLGGGGLGMGSGTTKGAASDGYYCCAYWSSCQVAG